MDNLSYIEKYFNGEVSEENKKEFEQRIIAEPDFAAQVAFYLSSKQAAAAEMKAERERLRETYTKYKQDNRTHKGQPGIVRKLWPWVAVAAVMAGIVIGFNIWFKPVSPAALADQFIKDNFQTLPVKMSAWEDSLQTGLRLYNEGRFNEALTQFETLIEADSSFADAKKYAGVVSLRMEQYDKAIYFFSQLENYTSLYANPGKFYHALTLLKRNQPGDKQQAKILLEQVVQNGLDEKEAAREWLNKW